MKGHLSSALSSALEELALTQTDLGEKAGVGRVQVNRAARGTVPIGPDVISRIVSALPAPQRGRVLAGWLLDQVPDGASGLVEVVPVALGVGEEPPAPVWPKLDGRRDSLLRWVADRIPSVEFCDMLDAIRAAVSVR